MYLDAIALWGGARGYRRWFVVHQDDEDGAQLRARAAAAVLRHGDGGEIVGAASAFPAQPFYGSQIEAAANANADAILVLLSDVDQIAFVAQQENFDPVVPSLLLPYPNTQTRDYIAAFRQYAPITNPDFRFALWDTTLTGHGAAEFNTRYVTRWGDPADPPAWSAYQAINIVRHAAAAVGGVDGPALADYLGRSAAEFDVLKGPGISFRPWNHQLRQPLYLVRVDQEAVWDRNIPSSRVAIANYAGTVPAAGPGGTVERLDLLGEDREAVDCRI
jgi:ABC-type branched-subunit amino acid transport system substrate-binding protein